MGYGIQMYGMRNIAEKEGLDAALGAVAEIGYRYVEFFDFYGHTAEEVKAMLDKYGLSCISCHTPAQTLVEDFDGIVKYYKTIGCKNYVIPGMEVHTTEKLQYIFDLCKEYIPRLAAEGITLHYHNHAAEFAIFPGGIYPYGALEYKTDLRLESDVYWVHAAKLNPVDVLERLHDRIDIIHVRDGGYSYDADGTLKTTNLPLGRGTTPLKEVVATAKKYGMTMIVESDTPELSDYEDAKLCYDYLKSME